MFQLNRFWLSLQPVEFKRTSLCLCLCNDTLKIHSELFHGSTDTLRTCCTLCCRIHSREKQAITCKKLGNLKFQMDTIITLDSHIRHRGGNQAGKIRLRHQWICLLRLKSQLDLEIQILSANLILPPYKPF